MRARKHIELLFIGILLGGLLLSGCKPDEPTQQITLPISICLPAGEVYAAKAPEQRAFGDPGTTEQFALPTHIYIYIVKGDKVWEIIEKTPSSSDWTKTHYDDGPYDTKGDSVYMYTPDDLSLLLDGGSFTGRVYIVASAVELDFNEDIKKDGSTSLSDLLDLSFSFDTTTGTDEQKAAAALVEQNLQNIYSTPYNYTHDYGSGSVYYGSFYATQKVPRLNLLLYHVASKVDLMWNVAEEKRDSVKISYVAATHLYQGPCFVFRPTENSIVTDNDIDDDELYGGGYTKVLLDEDPPCPGTQWNGRKYFYAIPYKNNDATPHYPLQIRLQKGGDSPTGSNYYWSVVKTDVPSVWTPWIRSQITINKGKYNITP